MKHKSSGRAMFLAALTLLGGRAWLDELQVAGWPTYGGDPGGSRYSRLADIRRDNVKGLRVAWT